MTSNDTNDLNDLNTMTKLIFATNNQHKVDEIKCIVDDAYEVISLKDAGIAIDIPEPHETLEANAAEKSKTIYNLTGQNCFGEDTGLEVDALNGAPGVRSARFAGEEKNFEDNIQKLLLLLHEVKDRAAKFRTVISLMLNSDTHLFEGICEGSIAAAPAGENGFGYDSVFIPSGAAKTFAQMTLEEKNFYSHRKKATDRLLSFLKMQS